MKKPLKKKDIGKGIFQQPGKDQDNEKTVDKKRTKSGFVRYTVMIQEDDLEKVKEIAKLTGLKIREVVGDAIANHLESYSPERIEKLRQAKKLLEELRKGRE